MYLDIRNKSSAVPAASRMTERMTEKRSALKNVSFIVFSVSGEFSMTYYAPCVIVRLYILIISYV